MGRPSFSLTDDQARTLVAHVNILLAEQLALPLSEQGEQKNHRRFVAQFIDATYKATNHVYGAGTYRKLLKAYAPGIKPATPTIDSEKKRFEQRLNAETDALHELENIDRQNLTAIVKNALADIVGDPKVLRSAYGHSDRAIESQLAFMRQQLEKAEQTLTAQREQNAILSTALHAEKASREALENELNSVKALLAQRDGAVSKFTEEVSGHRLFALQSIDAVRGETRAWQNRCQFLESKLSEEQKKTDMYRNLVIRRNPTLTESEKDTLVAADSTIESKRYE